MRRLRMCTLRLVTAIAMALMLIPSMGAQAAPAKQSPIPARAIFDARWYADQYPDVKAHYGYNQRALYQHFLRNGMKEGRVSSPIFDVKAYRAANPDLEAAFGDDWSQYYLHYRTFGVFENANGQRSSAGILFNPVAYAAAYPDVAKVLGNNWSAIINHFYQYGIKEGRTAGAAAGFSISADGTVTVNAALVGGGESSGGSSGHSSSKKGSGGSSKPSDPGVVAPNPPTGDDNRPSDPGTEKPGTTDPSKPGTTDPSKPGTTDPSKPGQHVHDWSNKDGVCATCGESCKEDHDALKATGGTCSVCGKVIAKEEQPAPVHPEGYEHTKADFENDDHVCGVCGMTLAEFQAACTEYGANHENLDEKHTCEVCGAHGTKAHQHDWSKKNGICADNLCNEPCPEDHAKVDLGKECRVCGALGTKEVHDRDSQHTKDDFNADESCKHGCDLILSEFQAACTEYGVDHEELDKLLECEVCGANGTKAHEHDWSNKDGVCATLGCDYECENVPHDEIDEKLTCGICHAQGKKTHEHNWKDGVCAMPECGEECAHTRADFTGDPGREACRTCQMPLGKFQEECTQYGEGHKDLAESETCEICGAQGVKGEEPCQHENKKYESNNDGTHNQVCGNTECNAVIVENEACDESGAENACSKCGYKAVVEECQHDSKKWVSNNDGTHNQVCGNTECNAVIVENEACDESGAENACSKCGYKAVAPNDEDLTSKGGGDNSEPTNGTQSAPEVQAATFSAPVPVVVENSGEETVIEETKTDDLQENADGGENTEKGEQQAPEDSDEAADESGEAGATADAA